MSDYHLIKVINIEITSIVNIPEHKPQKPVTFANILIFFRIIWKINQPNKI